MWVSEVWAVAVSLVCLWCPCMSAPTGKPLWVDPCGGNIAPSGPHHDPELNPPSDSELLTGIIISAKSALDYAKQFSESYVRKTFKQDMRTHHSTWLTTRYPWLPSKSDIPKELGELTPSMHFDELGNLDQSLLKSYGYLQRIAVGLEQVHHDKTRESEEFSEEFETVMYKLRQVLCEVNNALLERNPSDPIVDIERSIMDKEFRAISEKTYRHLRDWFIFRDFMNCLEYLIQLCEFYKTSGQS
ncbi:uncharacterized protein [Halyomorpha halys]|uniref:uncharacterized protein isoform X2 n=1 Tax=Halyomorpha halys TaxID=286706 RepID=UPI0006D527D6|nr:uncharacterized protein LOC106680845 isoform X2 [Halyomorpha halys]